MGNVQNFWLLTSRIRHGEPGKGFNLHIAWPEGMKYGYIQRVKNAVPAAVPLELNDYNLLPSEVRHEKKKRG